MELFVIQCTTCRARLKVQDEAVVGQILDCPKCGSFVQVVPPQGWKRPAPASETSAPGSAAPSSASSGAGATNVAPPGEVSGATLARDSSSAALTGKNASAAAARASGAAARRAPASRPADAAARHFDSTLRAKAGSGPALGASSAAPTKDASSDAASARPANAASAQPAPPPLPPKRDSAAIARSGARDSGFSSAARPAAKVADSKVAGSEVADSRVAPSSRSKPAGANSRTVASPSPDDLPAAAEAANLGEGALPPAAVGPSLWFSQRRLLIASAATGTLLALGGWLVMASLSGKAAAIAHAPADAAPTGSALAENRSPSKPEAAARAESGPAAEAGAPPLAAEAAANARVEPRATSEATAPAGAASPRAASPFSTPLLTSVGATPTETPGAAPPVANNPFANIPAPSNPAPAPVQPEAATNPPSTAPPAIADAAAQKPSGAPAENVGENFLFGPTPSGKNSGAGLTPVASLARPPGAPEGAGQASQAIDAGDGGATSQSAVEARLEERLPSIDFRKATLREFVEFIGEFSTVPVVLDSEALAKLNKGPMTPISVRLKNATVAEALAAALERHGLVASPRGGQLVITAAGR